MKKTNFIVVGCGYFGQKRIQALAGISNKCKLVGVVDINQTIGKKIARQYNVPYAASITKLLNIASADAAIIAVPNKYHKLCIIEALQQGLHVLCEKPLAPTEKEANVIAKASSTYRRFVKTGSNHRFLPTIEKAYELVQKGIIGSVLLLKGSIGNNGIHVRENWFWNPHISGGGTFIDNGCHMVDLANWFMGEFTSCIGATASVYWKQADVEDLGTGIYLTKSGHQAIITSSWTQWSGYMSLELWGDKGYILVDSKNNNVLIVGDIRNNRHVYKIKEPPMSSYQKELLYFASCIEKNIQPLPNALDGATVIHLISSLYKSSKQKRMITL